MNKELVSIIMLSHDRGQFVEESVKSILAQTYMNWELLFFDVNSKDDTASRMMELMALDSRIHVYRMPYRHAITAAINAALKEAKGRWIAFLNPGDLWEPEKLERQVAFMESNGYQFSYTAYQRASNICAKRTLVQRGPQRVTHEDLERCCWMRSLTVMYDARAVGLIQLEDYKYNNDYALWLKVSEKADCHLLPECLAKLRTPQSTVMEFLFTDKLNWRYWVYRQELGKNPFVAACMTVRSLWFSLVKRIRYSEICTLGASESRRGFPKSDGRDIIF